MWRQSWLSSCFALALALVATAGGVSAKIYHWVDKAGTPHFSDRADEVPAGQRYRILDFETEPEESSRVNIIQGLNGPGREAEAEAERGAEYGSPPAAVPPMGEFPGLAADPTEMLEKLKGPMMVMAALLSLLVFGFLFAFMAMALLLGCRLVGQESPGFKKAYGIVIVQFLAGMVAGPGAVAIFGHPGAYDLGGLLRLQAVSMGIFLLVHAAVLRGMLCDSMGKALGLAIVVNLVVLGLALLLGLGVAMCAGGAALLGA